MKNILLISLILCLAYSCSKSEDDIDAPNYTGTWERTWINKDLNEKFIQTIEINKTEFKSTINLIKNNLQTPYIKFEGSQVVIDMTLEVWIEKMGVIGDNGQMEYKNSSMDDFESFVYESININTNFIGFYIINNDILELVLDFNNDGVAGDNERSIMLTRVKSK